MSRFTLIALSLALTAGCVSKKKYDALMADHQQLEERHEDTVTERVAVTLDRAALRDRVAALTMRNAELASYYHDLLEDFGPAMDRGEVTLLLYPDHTSLAFSDSLTLDSNKASLTPKGEKTISMVADLIEKHPTYTFEVQGHTDARPIASGPYDDNWQLGAARALTVLEHLVDKGVEADHLSAATYAATEPIAPNDVEWGREMNRRVEIALETDLQDLPYHEELIWEVQTSGLDDAWSGGMASR